ncbi:MAG: hypothetical protein AAF944_01765 [Bacteroidota bacterium]
MHTLLDTHHIQAVDSDQKELLETLSDHLERSITIDAFLDDYPTVSKEQLIQVLELVGKLFTTNKIKQFYEIASCVSSLG